MDKVNVDVLKAVGSSLLPTGVGCAAAAILSFHKNKSIGQALLHGAMGWTYVGYRVFRNK